jgi:hypothetical protein
MGCGSSKIIPNKKTPSDLASSQHSIPPTEVDTKYDDKVEKSKYSPRAQNQNGKYDQALRRAASRHDLSTVETLVKKGVVNAASINTALSIATENNHEQITKYLKEHAEEKKVDTNRDEASKNRSSATGQSQGVNVINNQRRRKKKKTLGTVTTTMHNLRTIAELGEEGTKIDTKDCTETIGNTTTEDSTECVVATQANPHSSPKSPVANAVSVQIVNGEMLC